MVDSRPRAPVRPPRPGAGLGRGGATNTARGLTDADCSGRDFAGTLTLRFGFVSNGDVLFGDESISLGVDDIRVDVTPVPEPGTALLLGSGASLPGVRCMRV